MRASQHHRQNHHVILVLGLVLVALIAWADAAAPQVDPILLETPYAPSGYARLLRDYVIVVEGLDGRTETVFDYARFHASANQRGFREELRARFLSANPETMDPGTRRAWAVNAYNFLVIDLVTEHFVAPGNDTLVSIRDLGPKPFAVFEDERYQVGDRAYSLNGFERHFVFNDGKKDASGDPVDPRLHFVLVCAARGCPPLLACPLAPETMDGALDGAVRNALRSPHRLHLEDKTLHVTKIFEWYAGDFQERNPRAFLARYAPDHVRLALAQKDRVKNIKADLEWDWDLNRP